MAGLVPAIHVFASTALEKEDVDARHADKFAQSAQV
jgi:hypothetical protein